MAATPNKRSVAVLCGGSNGNHVLAAKLGADPSWEVRLVTRQPAKWSTEIEVSEQQFYAEWFPLYTKGFASHSGTIDKIYGWDEVGTAMQGADIVIFLCPVAAHRDMLGPVVANLPDHPIAIGTAYGQGGFDWIARQFFAKRADKGYRATLFALKHFPYLCKATEYGSKVKNFGNYSHISAAVAPDLPEPRKRVSLLLERMFDKSVKPVGFPICTVGATNQSLHPGILSELFQGYTPSNGVTFPDHSLFYGSTGPKGQHAIFQMQFVEFPILADAVINALRDHPSKMYASTNTAWEMEYEAASPAVFGLPQVLKQSVFPGTCGALMGSALRSNMRLALVKSPMKPATDAAGKPAFVPITGSRMYIDDIPFGLCVLLGIAEILEIDMPVCREMVYKLQVQMGKQYIVDGYTGPGSKICSGRDFGETNAPQNYGVSTVDQLADFMVWDRAAEVANVVSNIQFRENNAHILPSKL